MSENWKHDTWVLGEIPTSGHNTPTSKCVHLDPHAVDTQHWFSAPTHRHHSMASTEPALPRPPDSVGLGPAQEAASLITSSNGNAD